MSRFDFISRLALRTRSISAASSSSSSSTSSTYYTSPSSSPQSSTSTPLSSPSTTPTSSRSNDARLLCDSVISSPTVETINNSINNTLNNTLNDIGPTSAINTINAIVLHRRAALDLEFNEQCSEYASELAVLEPRPVVYWGGLEERIGSLH